MLWKSTLLSQVYVCAHTHSEIIATAYGLSPVRICVSIFDLGVFLFGFPVSVKANIDVSTKTHVK